MRKTIATAACLLAGASTGAPLAAVGGAGSATHAAASVFHLSSTSDTSSLTKVDAGSLADISGAAKQWKSGYTGKGVDVAVIDSGVTPVDGLSAPGKVVYGPDFTLDGTDPAVRNLDVFGHGTHISGIIAGNGADETNPFMGVAPDSRILSVKVANADGTTTAGQVIAALNWVTDHRNDNGLRVRVVNLSLGSVAADAYKKDELAGAVERAWKAGVVVVVAGGNDGWQSDGLNNPAFDPYVVAVGAADTQAAAVTADDGVASFSSAGDGTRNPDVVAPGTGIQSLRVPGSVIDQAVPVADGADPRFVRGSGSSQAAGVVSGQVALLLQARPTLTPDQTKYLLTKTATSLGWTSPLGVFYPWPAYLQGAGEVELNGAVHASIAKSSSTYVQTFKVSKYVSSDVTTVDLDTSGARWSGVRWSGVRWSGVRWSGVRWSGADWG